MYGKMKVLSDKLSERMAVGKDRLFLILNGIAWFIPSFAAAAVLEALSGGKVTGTNVFLAGILGAMMIGFYGGILYLYRIKAAAGTKDTGK